MATTTKKLKDKVSTKDSYIVYKMMSDNPVSISDYLKIVNGYFKYIMILILDGKEITLPLGMGNIYVKATQEKPKIVDGEIRGLAPDWVATKKLWADNPEAGRAKKLIYCTNEHTNGLRYAIKWMKKTVVVENITFYSLRFSKPNKVQLSKLIKSGKEYLVEKVVKFKKS